MIPKRNTPAAGSSGGRAPLPATLFVPRFAHYSAEVLHVLLHVLRDSFAFHLYALIHAHCVFETGEFYGSYARLMELMTPPQPERGKRRSGPSYWTLRRCIDDMEREGLLKRSTTNEAQGQLRLWLTPPKNMHTPKQKISLAHSNTPQGLPQGCE